MPMLVSVEASFLVPVHSMVTVWSPDARVPVFHTFCWYTVVAL